MAEIRSSDPKSTDAVDVVYYQSDGFGIVWLRTDDWNETRNGLIRAYGRFTLKDLRKLRDRLDKVLAEAETGITP
jgi:hypothetical protein